MPAAHIVILLSLGSFQAIAPGVSTQPSPRFADTAPGTVEFVNWARATLPEPGFNQPALQVCVVGAVPFTAAHSPYMPRPLWESQPPFHSLEPYAATFHYVEPKPGAKPPPPRTLRDAQTLCSAGAKR